MFKILINVIIDDFYSSVFKSYFRFPKNSKRRFGEGGKRLSKKRKIKKPTFSIITVVLNNQKFLETTIKSVLNQSFKNYEYIIIDGGSNDRTMDIIKKYENKIDYWVSEKDKGLYDAFNKGMMLASGEFIGNENTTVESGVITQSSVGIPDSFKNAVIAGRQSYKSGRIDKILMGNPSSPSKGII